MREMREKDTILSLFFLFLQALLVKFANVYVSDVQVFAF